MEHANGGQFLTFGLNQEIFAFDVLQVKEIIEMTRITKVPRAAPFMAGVLNLRGAMVPVVDLRLKFGMPATPATIDSAIIIVEVDHGEGPVALGALVDQVHAVKHFEKSDLEPPPQVGMHLSERYMECLARMGKDFVIVLNPGRTFTEAELREVQRPEPVDGLVTAAP